MCIRDSDTYWSDHCRHTTFSTELKNVKFDDGFYRTPVSYTHLDVYKRQVNIRDFAHNKHNKVDDYTYGGGAGMLMQAEPVYQAVRSVICLLYTSRTTR